MVLQDTPSILITDDDQDFRETLGQVLEPRGFRTMLANEGTHKSLRTAMIVAGALSAVTGGGITLGFA